MTKDQLIASFSTGFLLFLAWPPGAFAPLLLVALVPLLLYIHSVEKENDAGLKILKTAFLSFFIWTTSCLYWIFNAGQGEGFFLSLGLVSFPVLYGAILPTLAILLFFKFKKTYGSFPGYISLPIWWIAYEYFYQEGALSFPWLNLGNGFAYTHQIVQWYEYTGIYGGSLWVIICNILVFKSIDGYRNRVTGAFYLKTALIVAFVPMLISEIMYLNYEEEPAPINVVVAQPNIDPFNEKFGDLPAEEQLDRMIRSSDSVAKINTELFIWPETAIVSIINENFFSENEYLDIIGSFLTKYKNGNILCGTTTMKTYRKKETETARLYEGIWFDTYNSALMIENPFRVQTYHKMKLVPGVEFFPFQSFFHFLNLDNLIINIGGTTGGFGKDNACPVLYTRAGIGVSPVICYESIFGEHVGLTVKEGAQLIAIITNDGWWKNTSGYKHHALYAKLRAIETKRSIARSANTGISSFINQRGDVLQKTAWDERTAITTELNLNSRLTFYVLYGDYIAKSASWAALFLTTMLIVPSRWIRSKN